MWRALYPGWVRTNIDWDMRIPLDRTADYADLQQQKLKNAVVQGEVRLCKHVNVCKQDTCRCCAYLQKFTNVHRPLGIYDAVMIKRHGTNLTPTSCEDVGEVMNLMGVVYSMFPPLPLETYCYNNTSIRAGVESLNKTATFGTLKDWTLMGKKEDFNMMVVLTKVNIYNTIVMNNDSLLDYEMMLKTDELLDKNDEGEFKIPRSIVFPKIPLKTAAASLHGLVMDHRCYGGFNSPLSMGFSAYGSLPAKVVSVYLKGVVSLGFPSGTVSDFSSYDASQHAMYTLPEAACQLADLFSRGVAAVPNIMFGYGFIKARSIRKTYPRDGGKPIVISGAQATGGQDTSSGNGMRGCAYAIQITGFKMFWHNTQDPFFGDVAGIFIEMIVAVQLLFLLAYSWASNVILARENSMLKTKQRDTTKDTAGTTVQRTPKTSPYSYWIHHHHMSVHGDNIFVMHTAGLPRYNIVEISERAAKLGLIIKPGEESRDVTTLGDVRYLGHKFGFVLITNDYKTFAYQPVSIRQPHLLLGKLGVTWRARCTDMKGSTKFKQKLMGYLVSYAHNIYPLPILCAFVAIHGTLHPNNDDAPWLTRMDLSKVSSPATIEQCIALAVPGIMFESKMIGITFRFEIDVVEHLFVKILEQHLSSSVISLYWKILNSFWSINTLKLGFIDKWFSRLQREIFKTALIKKKSVKEFEDNWGYEQEVRGLDAHLPMPDLTQLCYICKGGDKHNPCDCRVSIKRLIKGVTFYKVKSANLKPEISREFLYITDSSIGNRQDIMKWNKMATATVGRSSLTSLLSLYPVVLILPPNAIAVYIRKKRKMRQFQTDSESK